VDLPVWGGNRGRAEEERMAAALRMGKAAPHVYARARSILAIDSAGGSYHCIADCEVCVFFLSLAFLPLFNIEIVILLLYF
jgi:hypothetical protein